MTTTFVQGDTLPIIRGTIYIRGTRTVVPLSDVESVTFQMRKSDDRAFQVDADAVVTDRSEEHTSELQSQR